MSDDPLEQDLNAVRSVVEGYRDWSVKADPEIPAQHAIHDQVAFWLSEPHKLFLALVDKVFTLAPRLPHAVWPMLRVSAENMSTKLGRIDQYASEYKQLTNSEQRQAHALKTRTKIRDTGRDLLTMMLPLAAELRHYDRDSVVQEVATLRSTLSEANEAINRLNETRKDEAGLVTQTREALAAIQSTALDKAVTERIAAFKKAAEAHDTTASFWLWATIVFALALIGSAAASICWGEGPPFGDRAWYLAANAAHFGGRVLIATVLSFLLVASVRNYRSSKHNAITNVHRAGALQTFETFTKGAEGTKVADAVVLQASLAAFAAQPTGFDEQKQDNLTTHVTELIKVLREPKAPKE